MRQRQCALGEVFLKKSVLAASFRSIWLLLSTAVGENVLLMPDIQKLHKSLKEMLELGMKIFIPHDEPEQTGCSKIRAVWLLWCDVIIRLSGYHRF